MWSSSETPERGRPRQTPFVAIPRRQQTKDDYDPDRDQPGHQCEDDSYGPYFWSSEITVLENMEVEEDEVKRPLTSFAACWQTPGAVSSR
jgi:hypothetical protein